MNFKELVKAYEENAKKIVKKAEKGEQVDYWDLRTATQLLIFGVEEGLKELLSFSGCVSCKHSKPHPNYPVTLTIRSCELGLNQNNCNRYEKLEIEEENENEG